MWHAYARCIQALLLVKRGDVNAEGRVLRPAFDELRETRFSFHYTGFLGALGEGLGATGRVTEGLATIDEAIERSERTEERWSMAELLRVKGELRLLQGEPNLAEEHWLQALDWARPKNCCRGNCVAPRVSPGFGINRIGPFKRVSSWHPSTTGLARASEPPI